MEETYPEFSTHYLKSIDVRNEGLFENMNDLIHDIDWGIIKVISLLLHAKFYTDETPELDPRINISDYTNITCALLEKSVKIMIVQDYKKLKISFYYNARGTGYKKCISLYHNMMIDGCMYLYVCVLGNLQHI